MNEITLPPSPNWYFSNILACASNGTVAWGARNSIVIAKANDENNKLDYKIIDKAHTERLTSVAFAPKLDANNHLSIVSSADDNVVKVWNIHDLSLQHKNSVLNVNQKVIGADWSKQNPNLICFVSEDGVLVTWDIKHDITHQINLSKLIGTKVVASCIACCPHDSNIVSIGTKSGLICIIDVRANSKANYKYYKLRGHNKQIVSLSWCPVPINVFQEKETKEFLLASGAKDREIYLWKAGTDYRYEAKLTFSSTPLESTHHKTKVSSSAGNFTAVCWLEPTTLLTSSPWAELLMWDLTGYNPKKTFTSKLVHDTHSKGLFSIAGLSGKSLVQTEKSVTSENENWRIRNNTLSEKSLAQTKESETSKTDNWRIKTDTLSENSLPKTKESETSKNDNWRIKNDISSENSLAQTEESETLENYNWRIKNNIKAIWTMSQDRQVVCSSLVHGETTIEYKVPTIGGFVYCMSACPVDTSQIAFGVGDNMIRLWNLTEPHEKSIDLQVLWEKIMSKVRALCWHSEKENLLAFATDEGRIGVFDTNVRKPPVLYRHYHRQTVYRIGWGPAPNVKEHALYSSADYELVYYTPGKTDDSPTSVLKKDCTEFNWKPDYSLLAVGFVDGSISFLNTDLSETGERIRILNKPIQCLAWHPESTSSDLNFSPMQNYLAVATNESAVTILDISSKKSEENESFEVTHRLVATLKGHSEKVVCLAWSPHISGYLVSGAYDYSAQVWKVETQEVIASFTGHLGPLQCCMWSPLSQDLILTGSTDFTLQVWNISKQGISIGPHATLTSAMRKRTKKKKTKVPETGDTNQEMNSVTTETNDLQLIEEKLKLLTTYENNDVNKAAKKKKKKATYFPKYAEINKDNDVWCSTVKNLLDVVENDSHNDESGAPNCNKIEHSTTQEDKNSKPDKVPLFLGNKKDLEEALNEEINILESLGHYNFATEIDLWRGNLKENLRNSVKKKRLNEFAISLSASVSIEFWKEICEAYAVQLNAEEHYHKAASYLLCLNKVNEAIDIFLNANMYKEAYVLAASNLDSQDPMIEKILTEWANTAHRDGHFQNASECYIKLKDYAKAAKVLERRKDLKSLTLAIDVAEHSKDNSLMTSIADKALFEALITSDIQTAKSLVKKYPVIQYREIEIEIFDQLSKLFNNFGDEMIVKWLKGSPNTYLLEGIQSRFLNTSTEYSLLVQKDVFPVILNEEMVQVSVSHQFALSMIADKEELALKHIVTAFDIILQYEKSECAAVEGKLPFLIKYFSVFDNRKNIIDNYQNELGESFRGYFLHAIIDWYLKGKLNEEQKVECVDSIVEILEKCIGSLLNKETVKFWTVENEIKNLEMKLTEIMGKIPNDADLNDTQPLIERLDQLRNEKSQFIQQRVSSPNPLLSYSLVLEFINKIPNNSVRDTMNDLIMNIWLNVIS